MTLKGVPLSPALATAGRKVALTELHQWLRGQPSAIAVRAETAEEAIAFVAASFHQLSETERDRAVSRTIVVRSLDAWQMLVGSTQPLLLVPVFADRGRTPAAVGRGHHVLLPQGRNEPQLGRTIEVLRVRSDEVTAALMAMGFAKERAEQLAPLARNSIGALRRQMAVHPAALVPAWATPEVAATVLPAILAGRWNEENKADREVIAALATMSYADYRKILLRWASESDPPFRQIGTMWTVVAKDDAWALLSSCLTNDDLLRLETSALESAGEVDPKYELPPEKRWQAPIHGQVPRHSSELREGLADTLALMAATSDHVKLNVVQSGQEWADRIVRKVLDRATTWQAWASFCGQLRSLAEAAPDVFLNALSRVTKGEKPLVVNLFVDADPFFSSSPHTELLWALETLAWSPNYLGGASVMLAKLARLDPGGKLANRPSRSLREIFFLGTPVRPRMLTNGYACLTRS